MPTRKASGLLADLTADPPRPNARTECRLIEMLSGVGKEESAAFLACIDNPKWTSRALAAVLTKNGLQVSAGAVQNHRTGNCPCYHNREAAK